MLHSHLSYSCLAHPFSMPNLGGIVLFIWHGAMLPIFKMTMTTDRYWPISAKMAPYPLLGYTHMMRERQYLSKPCNTNTDTHTNTNTHTHTCNQTDEQRNARSECQVPRQLDSQTRRSICNAKRRLTEASAPCNVFMCLHCRWTVPGTWPHPLPFRGLR